MQSKLIQNRSKARQILAFDGLQWGKCRCTDIDLSVDWQGKTFIFCEIKTEGSPLTMGQKYHLEGLVKAIRAGGKTAYAIVACHQTKASDDVHVAEARVDRVYDGNTWEKVDTNERLSSKLNELYNDHIEEYQA
jgi:hypothetical protein